MDFIELEKQMNSRGIISLADIARYLSTTPQAVSNWKARNQVPYKYVVYIKTATTWSNIWVMCVMMRTYFHFRIRKNMYYSQEGWCCMNNLIIYG